MKNKTEKYLVSVLKKLEKIKAKETTKEITTKDFIDLPYWLGFHRPDFKESDEDKVTELVNIIKTSDDYKIKGLSITWLSCREDINDLPLFENFLNDNNPSYLVPGRMLTQQVRDYYPAFLTEEKISEIALSAIGTISHMGFKKIEDYLTWKKEHPNPQETFEYWDGIIPGSTKFKKEFENLTVKNPILAIKVAIMGNCSFVSDQDRIKLAKKSLSPTELFEIFTGHKEFEEFKVYGNKERFLSWFLDSVEDLFDKNYSSKFYLQWRENKGNSYYAEAAIRMNRQKHKEIVLESLAINSENLELVKDLLNNFLDEEISFVLDLFFNKSQVTRSHIFEAIGDKKIEGISTLKKLVQDKRFNPIEKSMIEEHNLLLIDFLETAKKLSAPINDSFLEYYPTDLAGGGKKIYSIIIIGTPEEEARFKLKREDAIEKVKIWLKGN